MASRFTHRSKEAPMEFEWTNRSPVKPAWAAENEDGGTPRKRSHDALDTPATRLDTPQTPTFGSNQNVPFLFQPTPIPQTPQSHPWAPPPQFSISKAFPQAPEIRDVDMSEASPARNAADDINDESPVKRESSNDSERPVANGALRRVYKQRTKRSYTPRRRAQDDGDVSSTSDSEDEINAGPLTRKTSNHYTLNMPAHPAPQSDLPYVLLGYLQFFFNLSLILIFLYLSVQFIITVQRDVQHRISEYSQDIIQGINMCAMHYQNNRCGEPNVVPAVIPLCSEWETCMNRDPALVGRARVGAELIAEVVNGFVEPISWKTLIFTLTSLAFLTVFINTVLSLYRAKHQPAGAATHQAAPAYPSTPFPPPHFGYLPPAPTASWGPYRSEEDLESPTRRRRLEGGVAEKIK